MRSSASRGGLEMGVGGKEGEWMAPELSTFPLCALWRCLIVGLVETEGGLIKLTSTLGQETGDSNSDPAF